MKKLIYKKKIHLWLDFFCEFRIRGKSSKLIYYLFISTWFKNLIKQSHGIKKRTFGRRFD